MATFTRVFMMIFLPISYPVAKLLEFFLGKHHGIIYRRRELRELIKFHAKDGKGGGDLEEETVTMAQGALGLQDKVSAREFKLLEFCVCELLAEHSFYSILYVDCQRRHDSDRKHLHVTDHCETRCRYIGTNRSNRTFPYSRIQCDRSARPHCRFIWQNSKDQENPGSSSREILCFT